MGWNITGTPQQILKLAANLDDVEPDSKDKVDVKEEEKADGEAK